MNKRVLEQQEACCMYNFSMQGSNSTLNAQIITNLDLVVQKNNSSFTIQMPKVL